MNEEAVVCPPSAAKRKRSKRPRHMTSTTMSMSMSTSSSVEAELEFSGTTTEEEEDMANCLILLAQGRGLNPAPIAEEKFTSRRFSEAATTTDGKAGFYVYECKTCSKCFPSFQALGGHRASHKKPKIPPAEKVAAAAAATVAVVDANDDGLGLGLGLDLKMNSFAKSFVSHGKQRVHECSICGSEFSSGQALGGHMRRHRPAIVPDSTEAKKVLSLDLNLPAPSEEEQKPAPAAGFASLVFSTSAMVDCHY